MSIRDRHQRERTARRDAILAAAAKVFAEHGLEGATIDMVAREAEVAVGTIYLYFSSRDDLYLSLIAERVRHLRARYLEIKARKLDPVAELRAMSAAYIDYLKESRGLFLTQLSVSQRQLLKELKRKSEIEHMKRLMALSREVFGLWESSVRRVCEHGLIDRTLGSARAATILWASLNGAFLLTGDPEAFRDVTGLATENFAEEALEFQLSAASAPARPSVFTGRARGEGSGRPRTKGRERQQSDTNAPEIRVPARA
jgi:AcrR family transcriptional regulator